ncbi:hypothetical protein BJY04DRAFT_186124 [Aspergillus karnatakaensis]|uniref:uncharacterized protein n=1 Tax=Aspergillus karnatakaensis TaxID=1810916 RepID=UPI003CCCDEA1
MPRMAFPLSSFYHSTAPSGRLFFSNVFHFLFSYWVLILLARSSSGIESCKERYHGHFGLLFSDTSFTLCVLLSSSHVVPGVRVISES